MKERLTIFLENDVIDLEMYDACVAIHEEIAKPAGFHESSHYETLMTHLAIAGQRIKNNEEITAMDPMIKAEISNSNLYESAMAHLNKIESLLKFSLPEEEKDYILLHLINVMSNV